MISSIASRPYSVKSYKRQKQIRPPHTLIQETLVQLNDLQMLKVILLYVLGEVVHLEEKQASCRNSDLHVGKEQVCSSYLYGAGHGAEGKHRSAVFDGGLTVKRSLSVNQQHGHLAEGDLLPTLRHHAGVNTAYVWGVLVSAPTPNLAAIRLVDHKDFAPDLDSSRLSVTAPPPGETCQRLLIPSHPRVILKKTGRSADRKYLNEPHKHDLQDKVANTSCKSPCFPYISAQTEKCAGSIPACSCSTAEEGSEHILLPPRHQITSSRQHQLTVTRRTAVIYVRQHTQLLDGHAQEFCVCVCCGVFPWAPR